MEEFTIRWQRVVTYETRLQAENEQAAIALTEAVVPGVEGFDTHTVEISLDDTGHEIVERSPVAV